MIPIMKSMSSTRKTALARFPDDEWNAFLELCEALKRERRGGETSKSDVLRIAVKEALESRKRGRPRKESR
jgi:hypothetical protein